MASAVMVELNQQIISDSIITCLDNPSGEKNEAPIKCNHFSIRGYVAELRRRDPKFCDPFSPYRTHDGSIEPRHDVDLPPMVVPEFRWWNCDGCLLGTTAKEAHYSAAHDDKLALPSKLEPPRDRNAENVGTSSELHDSRNYSGLAICVADRKGKGKAHVEDELIAPQTECKENGVVEFHQKNSISDGIEIGASKEDYMNHEDGKAHLVSLPDLSEYNKAPSENGDKNGVLISRDRNICEEEDDYFGIDRRKTPKVRLLSELLGLKETPNDAAKLKIRNNPPFSNSEDECTEIIPEPLVKKRGNSSPEKKPLLEKRNNDKKIKIHHGDYSLISQQKITPKLSKENGKTSETTLASTVKLCQEVQHSDTVIGTPRKSDVSPDLSERRSGNDRIPVTLEKDGVYLKPSSEEPMIIGYNVGRKHTTVNTSFRETTLAFRASSVITESQSDETRERSNCAKKSSKGKQAWIPEAKEGSPLVQHNEQVSSSVTNKKELMTHIQEIDINSIPTDDKVPQQGTRDDHSHDIPMDIVELMARNQYERNLGYPKDKHHSFSPSENLRSNGSNIIFKEQMPKQKLPHFLSWQSPLPKEARNSVINGFQAPKNSSKQTSLGPFSDFNQTHISFSSHPTVSQPQEFGLTANNWTGHMEAKQRYPSSFLPQTMEPYNTFRASSSRLNSEPNVWPSTMARNKGILSFGGVNHGNQKTNFSNTYNNVNKKLASYPKNPMGSVDLYSNEAIPAMHLLSLMHNNPSNRESRQPLLDNKCRTSIFQESSFASSFHSNVAIGKKKRFLTPIPLTSPDGVLTPKKPLQKRKGISGMSKPLSSTNSFWGTKDSAKYPYGLAVTSDEMTACPKPQKQICMVNRNPSEFNDLKELRRYMIRPEDLRPRETRHGKSFPRGNAKRQEMRMNKQIPCLVKNIAG